MEFVMLFDHLREHRDATERRLLIPVVLLAHLAPT